MFGMNLEDLIKTTLVISFPVNFIIHQHLESSSVNVMFRVDYCTGFQTGFGELGNCIWKQSSGQNPGFDEVYS